jgi:hypothetical protein
MSFSTPHAGSEPTAPSPAADLPVDTLLQVSRRLDWRFLLPDPHLGQIAYLGPPTGTLFSALMHFAVRVDALAPPLSTPPRNSGAGPLLSDPALAHSSLYDIVVATDPTVSVLHRAATLVRPGGALYLELHSPWCFSNVLGRGGVRALRQRPGWGRPVDYVTALQKVGLHPVEAYWFWPNFEACTKIMPLHDPTALLYALAQRPRGKHRWNYWQVQSKRWLVQQLAKRGVLEFAVPCVGIVAYNAG